MGSVQSCAINGGVPGNRSASLFSRRAHLLTTPKGRWYFLRKPCALRGGCGSCGSLMDNATSPWAAVIVHAVGKGLPFWNSLFTGWHIATLFRRLPAKIYHRQFCRSYEGITKCDTLIFSFAKEKQKRYAPIQGAPRAKECCILQVPFQSIAQGYRETQ